MKGDFQGRDLGKWQRLRRDLRALPPLERARLLTLKATKGWRRRRDDRLALRAFSHLGAALESGPTGSIADFIAGNFSRLPGLPIAPERQRLTADLLRHEFPHWVERCVHEAINICENRVTTLGHTLQLDELPAWHKDHKSGTCWPVEPASRLRVGGLNHGSDIKFVWELSRFHHGVTLARAFALTGNERFAQKFVSWSSDWLQKNPPGQGPNWLCAMEAAIRAVNLLWAVSLLAGSESLHEPVRKSFAKNLIEHGIFIFSHLERDEHVVGNHLQPVNGNHYLSDLAGLIYLACAFPDCEHASRWYDFALSEFFTEVRAQVDDEGVHWEYSPGYHRLVTEMVLSCLILLERQGVSVPADIRDKTVKMLEFIRDYRKPSGAVPLVRDIDNGRFCILGDQELTNHDHVLALGATYFDRPDLYPGVLFEDCLWYLGPKALEWHQRATRSATTGEATFLSSRSRLYRTSGFALLRDRSNYLLALCCPQGMDGYCGHTHNDFLSFELEAGGRTFLTDCGSYVYSQSPQWRNRFRSTASHNTITIDGHEQNRFGNSDLFEIDSSVRPKVTLWETTVSRDALEGQYTLTLTDGSSVTHHRRFVFLKRQNAWLIQDRITGTGRHQVEARFHFNEGIVVVEDEVGRFRTACAPGPNLLLKAVGPLVCRAPSEEGWVSKSYGSKHRIQVLRFAAAVDLPVEQSYVLAAWTHDAAPAAFPVELGDFLPEANA